MRFLSLFRKLQYHNSIETMPVYSWFELQKTNDLTHMLIIKKPHWSGYKIKKQCSKREVLILQNALQTMTNEYIDTFGINEDYKKILELKRDIFVKEAELAMTGDRINNTFINVLKGQLNAQLQKSQKSDTGDVSVHISKYMGYRVDTKTTSVKEFYSILFHIKKEVDASQKK